MIMTDGLSVEMRLVEQDVLFENCSDSDRIKDDENLECNMTTDRNEIAEKQMSNNLSHKLSITEI